MSNKQFIVSGFLLTIIICLCFYLKSKSKKQLFFGYKILWILLVVSEIAKIIYSTYFDIINEEQFNWGGVLPLYTCSMILFFLPGMIWSKSQFQNYCISFFSTIGLAAGLSNFIYLSSASFYPIFSYACFHSYFTHSSLVFVGLSLIITKNFIPRWNAIYEAFIPIIIFSIPANVINYIIYYVIDQRWVDYMLLMRGNGFGIFGQWSNYLHSLNLGFIFSLFVIFVVYPICATGIMLIDWGLISFINLLTKLNVNKTK